MPRPKGLPKTGGRKKGSVNAETRKAGELYDRLVDILHYTSIGESVDALLLDFRDEDPYGFLRACVIYDEERRKIAGNLIKRAKQHGSKKEIDWADFAYVFLPVRLAQRLHYDRQPLMRLQIVK